MGAEGSGLLPLRHIRIALPSSAEPKHQGRASATACANPSHPGSTIERKELDQ
jgi:hypothetical protein